MNRDARRAAGIRSQNPGMSPLAIAGGVPLGQPSETQLMAVHDPIIAQHIMQGFGGLHDMLVLQAALQVFAAEMFDTIEDSLAYVMELRHNLGNLIPQGNGDADQQGDVDSHHHEPDPED